MITWQDVKKSMEDLGVKPGDTVIVHSSFKSLGETENGADTFVRGLQAAVGEEGTVVFPTLCQKDWEHVYENWHMDAPSDVGYLTNYFRKLPGAKRSDQASHSVAAIGKYADHITETHGKTGLRYGIFGDTPFAADSPWEKMYHLNTKVIFLGVGLRKCTFRHFAEYCYIEKCLQKMAHSDKYEEMKKRLWCYDRWNEKGCWPHINNEYIQTLMEPEGKVFHGKCGDADVLMVCAKDFVDKCTEVMVNRDINAAGMDGELMLAWWEDMDKL